jgi:DNA-binding response OmpR family regulator
MIILYAEDDPEDVDVFREVLKTISPKIACIVAKDGLEALSILENSVVLPDIIFLDVNMPLLDGKECLKKIKGHKEFRNIPVVIYTTSTRNHDKITLLELGAAHYIIKPNTFQELYKRISDVVKGP